MKKLLKFLIISIIIIIIVITVLLFKLKEDANTISNNLDNETSIENTNKSEDLEDETNDNLEQDNNNLKKFEIMKSRKKYLEIEKIINNLISDMRVCNSEAAIKYTYKIESQELINKKVQELKGNLKNRISNKCNLDETFNSEIFNNIIIKEAYTINKIYIKEINSKISAFLVYGEFSKSKTQYIFMIVEDSDNNTYRVYLNDYIEKNYNLEDINSININTSNISKNKYNEIKEYTQKEAEQEFANRYFVATKSKLKSNPEDLYNKLDNAYKKKFKNLEDFIQRSKKMQISTLKSYKVVKKQYYTDIVCRDYLGNCILFRERDMMDYTVVLDPYTINVDTLIEEYDTDDQEKLILNIQKIAQMINMGDYQELYKKLNESFRMNNFKTLEELEKYINENFYNRSKIEYISSEKHEEGYFAIRIRIINEEKTSQRKLGTIIMKLYNGADFEASFSIE